MAEKKESTMEQVNLWINHLERGISDLKRDTNERQTTMEKSAQC